MLTPDKAHVHTITPAGIPLISSYSNVGENLTLNHKGQLQIKKNRKKRKRAWKKIEKILIFIGGIIVGYQIIK